MIQCMKFKSANTLQSMWSPVVCFQLNMLNPTTVLLVLVATFRFVVPHRSPSFLVVHLHRGVVLRALRAEDRHVQLSE